ncbi:MAG: hypothetical protein AAGE43_06760 [Pseudomonadota bacterium]
MPTEEIEGAGNHLSRELVIAGSDGLLADQATEVASLLGLAIRRTMEVPATADWLFLVDDNFQTRAAQLREVPAECLANLVHPTAFVSPSANLGGNVIVGAQSIVGMRARVGLGVLQNALSSIEHDDVIGDFSFLGTGAILCGHVTTGESVFIGGGATVKPRTTVGARTTLGTGAVLIKDALPDSTYIGNPARRLEDR